MITLFALMLLAADPVLPASYHVKLSVPVSTKSSKAGDPIRAAVISPESLLNGYLEGSVERVDSKTLTLRFTRLQYRSKTYVVSTEVTSFVNSKGHKSVDDDEKPVRIETGVLAGEASGLWIDEGAEFRLRVVK